MRIPRYWAQVDHRLGDEDGRELTVALWGHSDESLDAARAHASSRATGLIIRYQHRGDYEYGLDGVLREPVLKRLEDEDGLVAAVTRNRYGAEVLCTRDVVVADIDDDPPASRTAEIILLVGILWTILSCIVGWFLSDWQYTGVGGGLLVLGVLAQLHHRLFTLRRHDPLARFRAWEQANPREPYRLYRTSAGHRLILTGKRMAAHSKEAGEFLKAVGSDELYARLCQRQACYRARLTPKPWRIGMEAARWRWPTSDPAELDRQRRWLERYEDFSQSFDVAELVDSRGAVMDDPWLTEIVDLHDRAVCGPHDQELA